MTEPVRTKYRDSAGDKLAAYAFLLHQGARFELLESWHPTTPKKPLPHVYNHGQKRAPDLAAIKLHSGLGGEVALIASSVGATCLDLDRGDRNRFLREVIRSPAMIGHYDTPSGGRHIWLRDPIRRKNCKWKGYGASGDVKSRGGAYAALYDEGVLRVANGLERCLRRFRYQPAIDPFEQLELELDVKLYKPKPKRQAVVVTSSDLQFARAPAGNMPGNRNPTLFDVLRLTRAYNDVQHFDDQAAFLQHVRDLTYQMNDQILQPLDRSEVEDLAKSVGVWTWARRRVFDASPEDQARRGAKSGKARRVKTGTRDAGIRSMAALGHPTREIAVHFGVNQSTVVRVLQREPEDHQPELL